MKRWARIALDLLVWRYGYVIGGRVARRHRFTGRVQLRPFGEWRDAHATWRAHFRPFSRT